ncbi:radical SAM protein [Brachyspira intermedia]|uniref:radical SAM protein n=1 Tax=Brachyspira intermedia TaxID=84377 RepID=UPI00300490A5
MSFNENDIVKSCKLIETGIRFAPDGIRCCSNSTYSSPIIISIDEINDGKVTYDFFIEKRKRLFEALNGIHEMDLEGCKNCPLVYKKQYKDVNFEYIGGHGHPDGFDIQHFTVCNLRCDYCSFTKTNDFYKPKYGRIIEILELFRTRNKVIGGNWIPFNGGEPSILENFDEILDYLVKYNFGTVMIFTNAVRYSESIYNGLKENKVCITTSIDAGTPSTFKKKKAVDAYYKVLDTIIRYKSSGTKNMFVLKYIICDDNINDDDLYGFVFAMLLIKPSHVYISIDYPYGDRQIPDASVDFGARMWLLLEKYGKGAITIHIQPDDNKGDPRFAKFSADIRVKYQELKDKINYEEDLYNIVKINECLSNNSELYNIINSYESKLSNISNNINKLAWWIPIKKWRDNFRNKMLNTDQTRPDQTRPDPNM